MEKCILFWGSRNTKGNQEGGNCENGEIYAFWGSRSTKVNQEGGNHDNGEIYAFWGSDTKITPLIKIIFFQLIPVRGLIKCQLYPCFC